MVPFGTTAVDARLARLVVAFNTSRALAADADVGAPERGR
jgi:hypothetical protein